VRCEQNRISRCSPGYLDRLQAAANDGQTAAEDVYNATITITDTAHAVTVGLCNERNTLKVLGLVADGTHLLGIVADHASFPVDRLGSLEALSHAIDAHHVTTATAHAGQPNLALMG
jgi:hypothetical protein